MSWTVRIDYVEGESPRDRMVRISRIIQAEKRDKGVSQVSMSRTVNELSNALKDTQKDQHVNLSDDVRGSIARRSPTVNLATNTGVKELDNYINKTLPDMAMLETYESPRQRALSLALPSTVGVPSQLRVPNLEADDRLMAANILGSLPSGGMTLEESARNKLAATVKQALGDLGISGSEVRSMLRDRLASRPFFNDPELIANFSAMIKAYHDVRENNLHYAQALVPGLKGLKSPERLTEGLLPTPESILNGTTAHLIFQFGEKTTISDFKGYVREFLMSILNIQGEGRGIRATDKQLQVGSFLAEFNFNRKKAAKALQKAIDDAISVGADFATAYSEIAFASTRSASDQDTALTVLQREFDAALEKYKDAALLNSDDEILDYKPEIVSTGMQMGDNDRAFFDFLVKERIIFPVLSSPTKKPKFYIIPVVLPSFTSSPIGWDRRWMISTMKIIDEYWDMIYNPNRKILIQDLLFLIATKTKELFNYDIDVVQMTILTLLLTPQRNARRRARSIMPRNAAGEVPLRTLTDLLKDSAREVRAPGEEGSMELQAMRLNNAIALQAAGTKTLQDDLKYIQETVDEVIVELEEFTNGIARIYARTEPRLVADFNDAVSAARGLLIVEKIDNEATAYAVIEPVLKEFERILQDMADGQGFDKFKGKIGELKEIDHKLSKALLYSNTALANVDKATFDTFNRLFALNIDTEIENPNDKNKKIPRDIAELQKDLYDKRKDAKRRGARRGRRSSTMKEVGFVTGEVVIGNNVFRDIGMGIRDFVGGRSNRMEAMIDEAMQTLVKELHDRAAAIGGDYVDDIAIQPIVYGGAGMLTLIAHGVAYSTGGKKVKSNPPPWHDRLRVKHFGWEEEEEISEFLQNIANKEGKYVFFWAEEIEGGWGYMTEYGYEDAFEPPQTKVTYFLSQFNDSSLKTLWGEFKPEGAMMGVIKPDGKGARRKAKSNPPEAEMIEEGEWTDFPTYGPSAYRMDYTTSGTSVKPSPIRGNSGGLLQIIRERRPRLAGGETGYGTIVLEEWAQKTANMLGRPISAMIEFDAPGVQVQDGTRPMVTEIGSLYWTNDVDGPSPGELNKLYSNQSEFIWGNELLKTFLPSGMKANPVETGRTDSYDTYTLAKSAAVAQANKEGETVYLWREGGKVKVSMFFPGKIDPREVTAIQPNPPPVWRFKEASMKKYRNEQPWVYPGQTNHGGIFDVFQNARNAPQNYERGDIYFDMQMPGRPNDIDVFVADGSRFRQIGTLTVIKKLGNANPPKKEERKYKGMIISKVDDGWEVDAYGKVFKTLKAARDFISKKVKGTAAPNQQCVRIIAGTRCIGTIVKMNKGGQYQCKKCKAKYKAV